MEHEPKPRPERAPEPKEDARVVAHRCPFCHEAVRPDVEAWVACAQCLGRQHAACWDESGRCGACRHEVRLEAPAAAASRSSPLAGAGRLIGVLAIGLAGLIALATSVAVRSPPAELPPHVIPRPPATSIERPAPAAVERPVAPPPVEQVDGARREREETDFYSADPREQARIRGAAGPGVGTLDPRFEWLPDRGDAERVDLARRMTREARAHISQDPEDPGRRVLEAHVQERIGDPDVAIVVCNEILDLDPRCGWAWTVRGWARLARGEPDRAELDLIRGQRLSHDPTWAHIGLGRIAEGRGDAAAALEAYEAALQLGGARGVVIDHAADLLARIERLRSSLPRRSW